jgi:hypothetical protein
MLLALWCVPYQVCPGTGDDHRLGFHCSLPQRRPPGVCIRGQRTVPSAGSVRSRQCRGEGDACTVGQGAAIVCPGILWSVLCRRSWQALAKGRTGRTSPLFATAFFVVRSTEAQPWRVGGSSYADAMSCVRHAWCLCMCGGALHWQQPQHLAASCRDPPAPCSWKDFDRKAPNPHVLLGAVVGGPDKLGVYVKLTTHPRTPSRTQNACQSAGNSPQCAECIATLRCTGDAPAL